MEDVCVIVVTVGTTVALKWMSPTPKSGAVQVADTVVLSVLMVCVMALAATVQTEDLPAPLGVMLPSVPTRSSLSL